MTRQQDGPPVAGPAPGQRPAGLGTVVLAGGRSARFGGGDKTRALLDGVPLLGHVLRAVPAGVPLVVVGPRRDDVSRPTGGRRLEWVLEEQRYGGPVVALAAGERSLPNGVQRVLVLAGDQPFAAAALPALFAAVTGRPTGRPTGQPTGRPAGGTQPVSGWVAVDSSGTPQPLLAVYPRDALRQALRAVLHPEDPPPGQVADPLADPPTRPAHDGTRDRGHSMRRLLAALALLGEVRQVAVPPASTTDVDTAADLDAARQRHPG